MAQQRHLIPNSWSPVPVIFISPFRLSIINMRKMTMKMNQKTSRAIKPHVDQSRHLIHTKIWWFLFPVWGQNNIWITDVVIQDSRHHGHHKQEEARNRTHCTQVHHFIHVSSSGEKNPLFNKIFIRKLDALFFSGRDCHYPDRRKSLAELKWVLAFTDTFVDNEKKECSDRENRLFVTNTILTLAANSILSPALLVSLSPNVNI